MPVRKKRLRQTAPATGKTVTEQHHAKTCNINYIIGKYQKTGLVEHTNRYKATYGDVSAADFEKAMAIVCEQETIFEELPSSIRKHYDNDVVNYLEAVETEEGALEHQYLLDPRKRPVEAQEEPEKAPEPEPEPVT